MSWDRKRRGSKGGYYYRGRRVNGRVVKEYVGAGVLGQMANDLDTLSRMERQAERDLWAAEEARIARASEPLIEFCLACKLVARAALLVAGYYQNHGVWRRRGQPQKYQRQANA